MDLKKVRAINKHNRAFVAEVNRKVGADWILIYTNKIKSYRYYREYAIELRHVDLGIMNLPLRGMDADPWLSRENLKEQIDGWCRFCHEPRYEIYHKLKSEYDRFYDIETLAEDLSTSLEENNEPAKSKRLKI